jgi:hypothetical protein
LILPVLVVRNSPNLDKFLAPLKREDALGLDFEVTRVLEWAHLLYSSKKIEGGTSVQPSKWFAQKAHLS